MTGPAHARPRLLGDLGASFARFAVETAPGTIAHAAVLRRADHRDVEAAAGAYLASLAAAGLPQIEDAALAVANPVDGDAVRMTNSPWSFSIDALRRALALRTLVVVNDFTALAMALPRLAPGQRRQVGGGSARERSVIALLGSGSGLGVSGLIPAGDGYVALGTEGGHAGFAPRDEREIAILRHGLARHGHLSQERVLSGPGLELIHDALRERAGLPPQPLAAPEITRRALAAEDAFCVETLDAFCAILGTAAANLALTLGALGGVYIGGAIVPRLGAAFDRSGFRARFEDKGRFGAYLRAIPTFVVDAADATLAGAAAILAAQLRGRGGDAPLLGRIERARDGLSPAERRVAEHVLAHPQRVLGRPVAEIARAANVSQPTVIRFCRTLGCDGLSDFKLRLASGLSATVPLTHTQVTDDDSLLEVGVKVLGNTASAILQVRDQLRPDALARAIELLAGAGRIELFAVGHYGVVADDARLKFLRFGIPSASTTDPRLQLLAARVLDRGDVAVLVSSSGRVDELLAVADAARERGAAVVAITAGQTPLARRADVALVVDHHEDIVTQVPMVGRILHLLLIDILAVGVATRQGRAAALAGRGAATASAPTPGVASAGALAQLTSHSR